MVDNYWGRYEDTNRGNLRRPNEPPPPPTSREETVRMLQALANRDSPTSASRALEDVMGADPNPNGVGITNDWQGTLKPRLSSAPVLGPPAGSGLGPKPVSALNVLGLADDEGRPNEQLDALIAQITQQETPDYAAMAREMAAKEFDPQFQILKMIAEQQESRYGQVKQATNQGYGALANEYGQSRNANKAMADQQVKTTNANYGEAAQDLSGNFNQSVQDNAAFLAKLGIKEGQGELAARSQGQMAKELGTLTRQQQLDTGLASQLGTNQYQADTSGIANTKFAGQETVDKFLRQYMDQQSQNDMTRLGLEGQRSKAESNYLMQLQQQQAAAENSEWERAFKEAGLGLDRDRLALSAQNMQGQDEDENLNPYDALQDRAARLYGGDPNRARMTADKLLQAYRDDPTGDLGALFSRLTPEDLAADPALQSLAFDFFNRMTQQNRG